MNNYSKIKFQNPIRDVRRATEGVADVTRIQEMKILRPSQINPDDNRCII